MMKSALVILGLAAFASAECPNSCSGHGECGEFDSCNCHTNYQGGDCSQRVCMYNWAWVTTAIGDVNYDGDLHDATYYSDDYLFAQGTADNYVTTDSSRGGTWERWPSFGVADEGHFYMECSNRGVCNRDDGLCECFEGYEGGACRRTKCPGDCSGHGTCETLGDLNSNYVFWDAQMTRVCKCDAGWLGIACDKRSCPYGNDPLTATNEHKQTVFIRLYDDEVTEANVIAFASSLSGYTTFKYTDHYGEAWETVEIAVTRFGGTGTAIETAAANALRGLPNSVFPDVTVTAKYCEQAGSGTSSAVGDGTALSFSDGSARAGAYIRYEGTDIVCAVDSAVAIFNAGSQDGSNNCAAKTTERFTEIQYPECVLLMVEYSANSGSLNAISATTDRLTIGGETNHQDISGTNARTSDSTMLYSYTSAATFGVNVGAAEMTTTAWIDSTDHTTLHVVTAGTMDSAAGASTQFVPESTVALKCGIYPIGTYTVDSVSGTVPAVTIVFKENIVVTNYGSTSGCVATQDSEAVAMTIKRMSNIITSTEVDFGTDAGAILTLGMQVNLDNGSPVDLPATITHIGATYLIVSNFRREASMRDPYGNCDASAGDDCGNQELAQVASASYTLKIDGRGTEENDECAGRGICDRETGICGCFSGYVGDSCESQNSVLV